MGPIPITLDSPSLRGRFCNSPALSLSRRCQPEQPRGGGATIPCPSAVHSQRTQQDELQPQEPQEQFLAVRGQARPELA